MKTTAPIFVRGYTMSSEKYSIDVETQIEAKLNEASVKNVDDELNELTGNVKSIKLDIDVKDVKKSFDVIEAKVKNINKQLEGVELNPESLEGYRNLLNDISAKAEDAKKSFNDIDLTNLKSELNTLSSIVNKVETTKSTANDIVAMALSRALSGNNDEELDIDLSALEEASYKLVKCTRFKRYFQIFSTVIEIFKFIRSFL